MSTFEFKIDICMLYASFDYQFLNMSKLHTKWLILLTIQFLRM